MRYLLCLIAAISFSMPAAALSLADLSGKDASAGLKQALQQGAETAVKQLGSSGGFLNNPKVKIPLPESVRKVEKMMRRIGLNKYVDELETSINRAAETAVPGAKDMLVGAVKQMTVKDAKGILQGGDDAGTQYFRAKTAEPLTKKLLPVVQKAIKQGNLTETYKKLVKKGALLGLAKEEDAELENYVTRKTLDGLYQMIAEEEKALRADPLKATGSLAKRVFGALR